MKDGIKELVSWSYIAYRNSRGINAFSKENENRVDAIFEIYGKHINSFEYSKIISSFRRKYVYNKNILVSGHDLKEIVGLMKMYNYIFLNIELKDISVYTILRLHQILYSMVPYPEFGGKVRNQEVCSFGAGMNISSYSNIPANMKKLYIPVKELIIKGKDLATKIGNLVGPAEIREFIDDCVDLNCKLIQIYPFTDGNGRTIRMFTNLLFKIAHIPPVYIENGERKEYYHAMNCAINNGDYSVIHRFYYYKVCDSFYENYLLVRSTNTNTNTNTN
ncbi:MAG: Fic family protein, partial [Bacilli bacterium]